MHLPFFEKIVKTKRDMNELVPEEDKMATIPSLLSLRFCKWYIESLSSFIHNLL